MTSIQDLPDYGKGFTVSFGWGYQDMVSWEYFTLFAANKAVILESVLDARQYLRETTTGKIVISDTVKITPNMESCYIDIKELKNHDNHQNHAENG